MIDASVSGPMKQRALLDRRRLKDRRTNHDRRKHVAIEVLEETDETIKISTIIHLAGALLMVLIGVKLCIFTGLLNPINPTVEKIGLTGSITLLYIGLFRHGFVS